MFWVTGSFNICLVFVMCTNFWIHVRHTWIADFDSVSLEYFSVFTNSIDKKCLFIKQREIFYWYWFWLICYKVGFTKLCCASGILDLFHCFVRCKFLVIFHYGFDMDVSCFLITFRKRMVCTIFKFNVRSK